MQMWQTGLDVDRLFVEALQSLGGLDVLVNNAGVAGPTGPVDEIAPEEWDRTLEVNITGQFNCARLAVKYLSGSSNPSIINLSSAAGRLGFPLRAPYSASKWAAVGFTKTLAIELGSKGIRVNAILPGVVEGDRIRRVTESKAQALGASSERVLDELLRNVSLRTTVTPQQIADQIVFLARLAVEQSPVKQSRSMATFSHFLRAVRRLSAGRGIAGFRCTDGATFVCETNNGVRYTFSTAEAEERMLSASDTYCNGKTRALTRMMKQRHKSGLNESGESLARIMRHDPQEKNSTGSRSDWPCWS